MNKSEFKSVTWDEVKPGDIVYLEGTYMGEFKAYGPHTVVDPKRRCLRNSMKKPFLHFIEDLLMLGD